MKGRIVVGAAAVGLYFVVLGCVAWTGRGASGSSATGGGAAAGGSASRNYSTIAVTGLPFRGAVIPLQRVDWIDKYMTAMDEVAADGGDTVLLQVDSRQENATSSHIYLDLRMTPNPDQLGALIDHAKGLKLRVILMPINLLDKPRNDEWRGQLKPESWDDWFDSYREMMGLFAWVAQAHHVDVLVIGSELVSTETYLDQWTRTIEHVRKSFKGALTYSANWDHYRDVKFWDQLDLVGMNCYYKLGPDKDVSTGDVEGRWREIRKSVDEFADEVHKPVVFLEVGWCSLANAANEPWDYTKTDLDADPDLQKRLYEAFFNSWYGDPHLGGFLIWQWPPGPPDEKGYTPKGKPAEQVLKDWLAKKPWAVPQ